MTANVWEERYGMVALLGLAEVDPVVALRWVDWIRDQYFCMPGAVHAALDVIEALCVEALWS